MGFKIASLTEMNNIAGTMSNLASTAQGKINSTKSTLDSLTGLISGDNVAPTLQKLNGSISTTGGEAITLLNDISTFITTQATSYTANEEDVTNALQNVNSVLEGLEV